MRKLIQLLGTTTILLLQACATNQYKALTDEERQAFSSFTIYTAVPQDEIRPDLTTTNSSAVGMIAGGLIGAVVSSSIDASINKKRANNANSLTEPLWNNLLDYDFRSQVDTLVLQHLQDELGLEEQPKTSPIVLSRRQIEQSTAQLKDGHVLLYISLHYSLVDDSKRVETVMNTKIFRKPRESDPLYEEIPPIYQNSFIYHSQLVGEGNTASISEWAANGAVLLEDTLSNSLSVLRELMLYDINLGKKKDACLLKTSISEKKNYKNNPITSLAGKVIPLSVEQIVLRHKSGSLYALEATTFNKAALEASEQCKAIAFGA